MTESEWLASADPEAMLTVLTRDRRVEPSEHGRTVSDRKLRLFACACVRQVWQLLTDERSRQAVVVAERFADGEATAQELTAASDAACDAANAAWAAWVAANAANAANAATSAANAACAASDAAWVAANAANATSAAANAACAASDAACAAANAANAANAASDATSAAAWDAARKQQAALLRDIAGNPFRPVTISPQWRTPTVLSLAQAAYEERLPDGTLDPLRLTILADALEEAGCDSEPLLRHLRGWRLCEDCVARGIVPHHVNRLILTCPRCDGGGWVPLTNPHVRGCWALDLIIGKE